MFNNIPVLPFKNGAQWEEWLSQNYELQTGIWLKAAKKSSGIESINRADALDVALCYGWIDGQSKSVDEIYYLQKYTPRRPRSLWSKVNIGKVELLIAAGRMQPSGLREITAAKVDGRWDAAYESPKNATIPPDLAILFKERQQLKDAYESLTKSEQYSILWSLMTAKTPTTRAKRLQKAIESLETQDDLKK